MSIFSFFQGYILLGLFSCFILASTLKPRQIHDNPIDLLVNRVRDKEYRLVGEFFKPTSFILSLITANF